jgi:hypothetical protein
MSKRVKTHPQRTDTHHMHGRPSLIARLLATFTGRRDDRVLVLVNTVDGVRAVPVRARDLLR